MEAIESNLKSENDEFELAPLIDKTSDVEAIHNSEKKNTSTKNQMATIDLNGNRKNLNANNLLSPKCSNTLLEDFILGNW